MSRRTGAGALGAAIAVTGALFLVVLATRPPAGRDQLWIEVGKSGATV